MVREYPGSQGPHFGKRFGAPISRSALFFPFAGSNTSSQRLRIDSENGAFLRLNAVTEPDLHLLLGQQRNASQQRRKHSRFFDVLPNIGLSA
jgi:hypothetical protein